MIKRFLTIALSLTIGLFFTSCEEQENVQFDNVNGQTALSATSTSFQYEVPVTGLTAQIPIQITTVSTSERTFNVEVDASTTANAANYSVGGITIPANEYTGTLSITFNDQGLMDGQVNTLVLNLVPPTGGSVYNETLNIEFFKEVICNDLMLVINTDRWASETSWEVFDGQGVIVASGGPFADTAAQHIFNFTLPEGCYTFRMKDSFGDGQVNGSEIGDYKLTCSILTHAQGEGALAEGGGFYEDTDFCVKE